MRLAILDDHELLLDSLSAWIAAHAPDFDLVLTVPTWFELVQSDQFPTDLVLLDFQLQEPVSIEARVRTCRAAGATVIVLTSLDTAEARDRRPLPIGAQRHARPKLSTSEREALALYASGYSMAEVATHMNVQYETAKTYLRRVREKYSRAGRPTSTKADLIRRAAEDGHLQ